MAPSSGQSLGHYELLSTIGSGGMGRVYRARDTRLNRMVAVKVLAGDDASRDEMRARLGREARAIASLTHPHICTVYDLAQHDGVDYLVMELLEGETLAERLRRGPMRMDGLVQCSQQVADALIEAHRRGLVHRDLKPANVMLTKKGAKLLDFGLARAVRMRGGDETLTETLTPDGSIVGTYLTCRRSSWRGASWMGAPISSPSERCCTRWRRGIRRSRETRSRAGLRP